MSKKKSSSKEDTITNQSSKQSDNKEDIESKKTINQTVPEEADTNESGKTSGEKSEPEPALTDKIGTPDRSSEEKLAEMQDRYIRLSAEFDNYRKRTLREKMELTKFAAENILLKILPFMDDFERALKNMEDVKDCNAVKEGIDLIHNKFMDFLKQNGISEIEALDVPFNFDLHHAIANKKVEDETKKGIVVEVIQKGYYLLDKVIRHSKVVVGE